MNAETMRLEVSIVPDAAAISMAQRVVDVMSRRILNGDQDVGWRLAMATHELLDNARKYGDDKVARFRFEITTTDEEHVANMYVRSRGTARDIEVLLGMLAGIEGAKDAWSFYLDAMRRSASREDDGSGLGLARIWAEGEMNLSVVVEDNQFVNVGAELRLGRQ